MGILRKNHKELIKSNNLILKFPPRFSIKFHNVFTKEVNKIALGKNTINRFNTTMYIWDKQRSRM